jgi:hypothetical protein
MFNIPKINNSKLMDGVVLGIGFTAGYILLTAGLKMADRFSGGLIPDEIANARVSYYDSNYGGATFNTLQPTGDPNVYNLD